MKEMNNEITVVNNLQAGAKIQNRYDYRIEQFFKSVNDYLGNVWDAKFTDDDIYVIGGEKNYTGPMRLMRDNWEKLREQKRTNIIGSIKPEYFAMLNSKDYSAYFAYIDAYNKIMQYYARDAKYNLKSEVVEDALNDWYLKTTTTKPQKLLLKVSKLLKVR